MTRGKFITFEGGDGVGKSTQIAKLADRLKARGISCDVTREPGGTPFAEDIRRLILGDQLAPHAPLAQALLFAAARVDHVTQRIAPALDAGQWVLCDRFADSTRAYQGAGGIDSATLIRIEALTHPDCQPDLTLIFDLDPVIGHRRVAERTTADVEPGDDPFERRGMAFQQRLRDAFLEIAANEPERCMVIDAAMPPAEVEEAVWRAVSDRLCVGPA